MKDQDNRSGQQKSGGADDRLQTLFQHAGAREKPRKEDEQAARGALHAEWQRLAARRKRGRLMAGFAVAATVVIAAGVVLLLTGGSPAPGPAIRLAVVENLVGTAQILQDEDAGESESLGMNSRLMSRQVAETGSGSSAALRWVNGQSIRLDENTLVRLDSASLVQLDRGRMYVDTANRSSGAEVLTIATPFGRVRHVGTQYMTAVSPTGTTVSVRSGKVALDLSGTDHVVVQSEQLNVSSDGTRSVQRIEPWGEPWLWTETVTPAFDSDGKTIADLIDWVASETGHSVEYDSPDAEDRARQTVLRGELELEPMKALHMITQTSGMEARVVHGLIMVSLASDS